ncbi:MAG: anti-sigma factor domain-containing protein [Thermoanaerobacteraceae bacterium]|nr:anti-sigma factor domain-containing protein [Thermoanaerobacteraceae bacterium]
MVVVTEEGDFLRTPLPPSKPLPGQTVAVPAEPLVSKKSTKPYWVAAAAAVLLLVLAASLLQPMFMPDAVAAVSMDLVSSVELGIAENNKVVRAKALNPEGQEVLRRLDLKGRDVYEAVNLVTLEALNLGYLQPGEQSNIIVTLSPITGTDKMTINRDYLQETMHDELAKRNYQGYLVVNQTDMEIWQEASKMGLPVNKYLLWEKSQMRQMDVSLVKNLPLEELIESNGGNIPQMFPGRWCRVGTAFPSSPQSVPAAEDNGNPGNQAPVNPGQLGPYCRPDSLQRGSCGWR